ncbi:DUF5615 family PIN-like protein [Blastopirellula marina]|uniref:DUF5615 domain-containing protein n=1 Tax=Blastopirellula marina DSM 3645 TaxID=314230 RepID=A3ZTY6_9BACT|nr:DUF5615 family PIN-like protein [Blastopirellula marina]EAQ80046.1 hypothetical protein DSM3645_05470 [Blastopirellula marina DSM 3645]
MARLYSNENFPIPVVLELRRLGHDIVTIQDRGRANEAATDPQVLAFAVTEGRAILTLNRRDFKRLHLSQPEHEGMIVCTADPDFIGQAARIHDALERTPDLRGQLSSKRLA